MGSKETIETICKAALLESALTKKTGTGVLKEAVENWNEMGLKKAQAVTPFTSYHVVHLLDKPLTIDTFQSFDPMIRSTYGKYMLTYLHAGDKKVRRGRRFVLDQDLIRARVFFKNWDELMWIASRNVEVAWIVRNSHISKELVSLCALHVGVPFCFTVDWVGYDAKIREQISEEQQHYFPTFLTHRCSDEDYYNKYQDLKMSDRRNINDYRKDIAGMYEREGADNDEE